MLTEQDKVKLQTFLNTIQEKCRERDSSVSVRANYNFFTNDWDVVIDSDQGEEIYVVAKDYLEEWTWLRKYKV
jgi:hypothetical protein